MSKKTKPTINKTSNNSHQMETRSKTGASNNDNRKGKTDKLEEMHAKNK